MFLSLYHVVIILFIFYKAKKLQSFFIKMSLLLHFKSLIEASKNTSTMTSANKYADFMNNADKNADSMFNTENF